MGDTKRFSMCRVHAALPLSRRLCPLEPALSQSIALWWRKQEHQVASGPKGSAWKKSIFLTSPTKKYQQQKEAAPQVRKPRVPTDCGTPVGKRSTKQQIPWMVWVCTVQTTLRAPSVSISSPRPSKVMRSGHNQTVIETVETCRLSGSFREEIRQSLNGFKSQKQQQKSHPALG